MSRCASWLPVRKPDSEAARKITRMTEAALSAHGRIHTKRLLVGALVLVVIAAGANLFGWDISGWFTELWNAITGISPGTLLAAIALITLQTTATAYAWYSVLRFGYPDGGVRFL